MKQEVLQAQADYTILILVRDTSGNAQTGLAFGDIDLAYARVEIDNDVTTTDVAPADLVTPALTDPHLDWGFLEVSAADHPGLYRLDIADEVFALGAWSAIVTLTGSGLEPSHCEFMLVPARPYDGVNVSAISGDSVAADNLELQYDGTGLLGDQFPLRQDQGASISGGLATRTILTSVTVIQGSEQDLANTTVSDGNRWTGDDDGAGAEFIFRCTPADTTASPGDLHFAGYYDEPGGPFDNTATLQVYNFIIAAWEDHLVLSNGSANIAEDLSLAGSNAAPSGGTLETVVYTIGDVLIKFKQDIQETGNACLLIDYLTVGFIGSALTASEIWDEVLTGATHNVVNSAGRRLRQLQEAGGYEGGAVWLDTIDGTAGTAPFENGTQTNPVDTLADALTLMASINSKILHLLPNSSITLTSAFEDKVMTGDQYDLALDGQSISGSRINNCKSVSGTFVAVADRPSFIFCLLNNITADPFDCFQCGFLGTLTIGTAGLFTLGAGATVLPHGTLAVIDYGAGLSASDITIQSWGGGGIEIQNAGAGVGTYSLSIHGWGELEINANCSDTTNIDLHGSIGITNNSAITSITSDTNYASVQLIDDIWDEVITKAAHDVSNSAAKKLRNLTDQIIRTDTAQGPGTGNNQIQLDAGASATDGAYDPSMICIVAGTGAGQSRMILEYDGSSKTATVDRDWKVNPTNDSEFNILCHPGREHVNEGLAQAGAAGTITLNELADANDGTYVGSIVFIRSGLGQDQSRIVTAYDGTTKVAIVDRNWVTTPDTTSGYVVLPSQLEVLPDWADGGRLDSILDIIAADTTTDIPALINALKNFDPANDDVAVVTLVNTLTTYTSNTPQSADNDTLLQAIAGYIDTEIAAIITELTKVPKSDSNVTWNAAAAAQIQSETNDALVAYAPPTKAEMDTGHGLLATESKQDTIDTNVDAIKVKTDNQPAGVQKNAALSNFTFLMVDDTDGKTPETGLTPTCTISKDGGAFTGCANAPSEISDGFYKINLTQSEMNADIITLKAADVTSRTTTVVITTSS